MNELNKNYYNDLSKFETLNQEQIKVLYEKYHTGCTKSLNILIESNLKLVIHYAKQYDGYVRMNESIEMDDIISEGNLSMIQGIKKYNPDLDIKISYYLSYWIKKGMTDFIQNKANLIKIPQQRQTQLNKIKKEIKLLYKDNPIEITEYDLMETNKFTNRDINLYFNNHTPVRFDYENYDLKDELVADDNNDEIKKKIEYGLKYLKSRERTMIKLYFGIDTIDNKRLNYLEIGEIYGITRQRVEQLINRSLKIMKDLLTL